jgi:hypothetical protein
MISYLLKRYFNGPFVFFPNLNEFNGSMYRCLYIDYLYVGPRLDTCTMLTSRVSKKRAGDRASSFSSRRREAVVWLLCWDLLVILAVFRWRWSTVGAGRLWQKVGFVWAKIFQVWRSVALSARVWKCLMHGRRHGSLIVVVVIFVAAATLGPFLSLIC